MAYALLVGLTPTHGLASALGEIANESSTEAAESGARPARIEPGELAPSHPRARQDAPGVGTKRSGDAPAAPRLGDDLGATPTASWVREASARVAADYESGQSTGSWWKSASKTRRTWTIVGAVLIVGISAAALSGGD